MSTGIETWNMNLLEIGPMYPFPGTEMIWALIGIATWILWHILQGAKEKKVLTEEAQLLSDKERLKGAIGLSSAETLKEQLRSHAENFKRD